MLFTISPSATPGGYGEALLPMLSAREHLRVDTGDEDLLIEALRDAAIDMVEKYTNLSLGPRTGMVARFAGFGERMRIGIGPASTLAVTAISHAGSPVPIALADGAWGVDMMGGVVPAYGARWPMARGEVTVTFSVGYPAGQCPAGLIAAARLFLGFLYANREAAITEGLAGDLPLGFRMLCDRYRVPVL